MSTDASARKIAFRRIAADALLYTDILVPRWLPSGVRKGSEWISLNPTRNDHRRGSFKVNLATGAWGDFAAGDCGGDLISLAAYLFNLSQADAAKNIAEALGVSPYE